MKISITNLKKTERLDPEYYFTTLKQLSGIKLSEISKIRVGKTPKVIIPGKTPFYRVKNIKKFQVLGSIKTVDQSCLSQMHLANKSDILLSIKGRVGDAAQILQAGFYNQDLVCIKTEKLDSSVLVHLLNTEFVNRQIRKVSTGQMHPQLKITDLRKVLIPETTTQEAQQIKKLVGKLNELKKCLHDLDAEINKVFQETTPIKVLKIINLTTIRSAKRLDPENFAQLQDNALTIKDLENIKVSIGKYKKSFHHAGTPYLRAKDIKNNLKTKLCVLAKPDEITSRQEVLVTRVGNIRAIHIRSEKIVPSDNFIRITVSDKRVSPLILTEYINSHPGQAYIKTLLQGSKQPRLNKSTILKMKVPTFSSAEIKHLQKMVNRRNKTKEKINEVITSLEQPMYSQRDPQSSSS